MRRQNLPLKFMPPIARFVPTILTSYVHNSYMSGWPRLDTVKSAKAYVSRFGKLYFLTTGCEQNVCTRARLTMLDLCAKDLTFPPTNGEQRNPDEISPNIAKRDVRYPDKVFKWSNISPNMMADQMIDRLHKPLLDPSYNIAIWKLKYEQQGKKIRKLPIKSLHKQRWAWLAAKWIGRIPSASGDLMSTFFFIRKSAICKEWREWSVTIRQLEQGGRQRKINFVNTHQPVTGNSTKNIQNYPLGVLLFQPCRHTSYQVFCNNSKEITSIAFEINTILMNT